MNNARQVLRFSIPGAFLLLGTITVHTTYLVFVQHRTMASVGDRLFTSGFVAAMVLASIPVGFILYQYYFWRYGPVTVKLTNAPLAILRADRGAAVLEGLDDRGRHALHRKGIYIDSFRITRSRWGLLLFDKDLLSGIQNYYANLPTCPGPVDCQCGNLREAVEKERWVDYYRRRWELNWEAVQLCLSLSETSESRSLRAEYTTLSDLYHSLGATRAACIAAPLVGVTYQLLRYQSSYIAWGYAVPLLLISWMTFFVLTVTRSRTWRSASSLLRNSFRIHSSTIAHRASPRP